MINIFNTNSSSKAGRKKRSKKRPKSHRKDLSKSGEEKLGRINPMAFGIFAVKSQENPSNEFLSSTLSVLSEKPHVLTDKWIDSINRFVESTIKSSLLDPPDNEVGSRVEYSNYAVTKIISPKSDSEYPMPALMCVDSRGWKYYFKTSKAYSYKVGDIISFTATVSSHKEGITFLRRPSKISSINGASKKEALDDK